MPRTAISEVTIGRGANAAALTFAGATPGDVPNGHYVPQPLKDVIFMVTNNDAAAQNVQFVLSTACNFEGVTIPGFTLGRTVAIPAGQMWWFSGYDLGGVYENDIPGVTVSGITVKGLQINVANANLSLRVLRMPTTVSGA